MVDVCSGSAWNWTQLWNSNPPFFSDCFQKMFFFIPVGLFFIFGTLVSAFKKETKTLPSTAVRHAGKHRLFLKIRFLALAIWFILCVVQWILHSTLFNDISTHLLWCIILFNIIIDASLIWRNFQSWNSVTVSALEISYYGLLLLFFIPKYYQDWMDSFGVGIILMNSLMLVGALCMSTISTRASPLKSMIYEPWECPELYAEMPSKLCFWWLNGIIFHSRRSQLTKDDVFGLRRGEEIKTTFSAFQKEWKTMENQTKRLKRSSFRFRKRHRTSVNREEESTPLLESVERNSYGNETHAEESETTSQNMQKKRVSLLWPLLRAFGPRLSCGWLYLTIHLAAQFINPFLLQILLNYMTDVSSHSWNGYLLGVLFFLVGAIGGTAYQQNYLVGHTTALRVQTALVGAVYRKAMSLSSEARQKSSVGEVVNLMSVDVDRIQVFLPYSFIFWTTPVQIILCLVLLWQQLGIATLAGVAVLIIIMPLNLLIVLYTQKQDIIQMKWKDRRLKLLHDILNGIRILKLYAWEPSYERKINDLRAHELRCLKNINIGGMVLSVIWDMAPFLIMVASLSVFMYTGGGVNVLTPTVAFVSFTLFNMLRYPMVILPWMMSFAVNGWVSMRRVEKFLNDEEIDLRGFHRYTEKVPDRSAIEIVNGSFAWKKISGEIIEQPSLSNIQLSIPHGQLIAVVGKIGVGKSSLLSAIIGEMHLLNGYVITNGKISYVPQTAWIQNMTVRENILFSKEYDATWYNQVVDYCCLRPDLDILPKGDETLIGERGLNLSGGQKQRISLARAVYQRSDIYLLDDPLSAVDAHVGKELYEKVIGPRGLLGSTTRILVTHSLQYLPEVDEVITLGNNGQIVERGTYQQLMEDGQQFAEVVKEIRFHQEKATNEAKAKESSTHDSNEELKLEHSQSRSTTRSMSQRSRRQSEKRLSRGVSKEAEVELNKEEFTDKKTFQSDNDDQEFLETGQVSFLVYVKYIRARGLHLFALAIIAYIAFSIINIYSGVWIQQFSENPVIWDVNTSTYSPEKYEKVLQETDYYMTGFGIIGLIEVISCAIFVGNQAFGAVRSAKVLHLVLLKRILKAPLQFFDTTPLGRLVNRFSKDIEVIDTNIPEHWNDCQQSFFTILAAFGIISYSTPPFLIALVPMVLIYGGLQTFYIPVARQSRRLTSVTRSPIYTHFSESLSGLSVIRAFQEVNRFIDINDHRVNQNARFIFLKVASNRWLDFYLQLLGSAVTFFAVVFSVSARSTLSPGLVGLSVSYALSVTDNLRWMVLQSTELETDAVSLERLSEYSNVAQEKEWYNPSINLPENWPHAGEVDFQNFGCRYRETLPLVLQGLEFRIAPGEKIGIVGRTGAGKSSLTLALFRLIERAHGRIIIDGVDIQQLGLHQLRSKLTILPQDPVLFDGTLRDNIDPFHRHSDSELWEILEAAHLREWASNLPLGLQHECGEGGQNLSLGQRQLVCLARALLRKSKLLILDEATAAVDQQTDRLLMETIFQEFQASTVIIIAHRLNTILNTNKVVVMSEGRIAEYGPPYQLMSDSNSYFHKMAVEAGIIQP